MPHRPENTLHELSQAPSGPEKRHIPAFWWLTSQARESWAPSEGLLGHQRSATPAKIPPEHRQLFTLSFWDLSFCLSGK